MELPIPPPGHPMHPEMLAIYGDPNSQPPESEPSANDLPTYEEFVAAGRSERQDRGACWECGYQGCGFCVDCQEPVCEKHSRALDGKLRCIRDADAHQTGAPPRLQAEAAAQREEERRWLADVERARQDRAAKWRAEADRKSQMPVLRGQDLADFLTGNTKEWVVGRVGDTDGVALAEALKLARVPPIQISIKRKTGFISHKPKFDSEQGWLIESIKNTADPDSWNSNEVTKYLLTDGRGLWIYSDHRGSYEQSPIYSAPTVRHVEYRLRLDRRK